jgi:cysteine desulfurase / selenocysteine lyase
MGQPGIGVLYGRAELLGSMPPFVTGGQIIEEIVTDARDL